MKVDHWESVGSKIVSRIYSIFQSMKFQSIVKIMSGAVSILLPRKCLSCSELLPDFSVQKINKSDICFNCAKALHYITRPVCIQCCEKFSYDLMHGQSCLDCMNNKWTFDELIACVSYSEKALRIAMQLKYKGIGAEYIARSIVKANPLLWESADSSKSSVSNNIEYDDSIKKVDENIAHQNLVNANLSNNIDYIVPTPLHWKRLWKRGFNQTELVGSELSKLTAVPMRLDILNRVRYTQSQGKLGQKERVCNVAGAFKVEQDMYLEVQDKIIVLLDDVVTTSSTIQAAAKALKKAGAKKVIVVCWAKRLVKGSHDTGDKYSFDDSVL